MFGFWARRAERSRRYAERAQYVNDLSYLMCQVNSDLNSIWLDEKFIVHICYNGSRERRVRVKNTSYMEMVRLIVDSI